MPPPPPPTNKGRRLPPEPLTEVEVDALLRAASPRSASGLRMRGLIAVMYGAGLRIAEALALMPRDVDLAAGTIRVRHGKGDKSRTVGIDPRSAALLQAWMDRRARYGLTHRHPVFATITRGMAGGKTVAPGQPLNPRQVRAALNRLAARAGITKRVHPHGLRHSLAFRLAQSGVPTHIIQAQLGHASLAVTDRYVRHLAPLAVVDVMRSQTWGADRSSSTTPPSE